MCVEYCKEYIIHYVLEYCCLFFNLLKINLRTKITPRHDKMAVRSTLRLTMNVWDTSAARRHFTMQLTSAQQEVRDMCRQFTDTELAPAAAKLDRDARFPYSHIKKLAHMGLMRTSVNAECGGLGHDMLSLALAVEELSRGCASTGFIFSIHNCLYANLLEQRGSEQQKDEFLTCQPVDSIGGFALSEPEAGSDAANLQTTFKEDGDHFILNGKKAWVTSAIEGRAIIVFATSDPALRHKGLACFVVPLETDGVFRGNKEPTLGVRAASVCSVTLQEVRIPRHYLIGEIGQGFKIAMTQLDQGRVGIAAHAVGIAQAALDLALEHASERHAFGRPLLKLSSVMERLTEMSVLIESARLLTWRAATNLSTKNSAMAKYVAGRNATAVADHAVQILGGRGLSTDSAAERHYRDARGTQIYGGVTDVQKMLVGYHLVKEYFGPKWRRN